MENLKVIDFYKGEEEHQGFTLYYGDIDCDNYWGDDWNDKPYEHNAGTVYDKYCELKKHFNLSSAIVLEPCDGESNSSWCKEDFKKKLTPCLIIVPFHVLMEHDNTLDDIKHYDYYNSYELYIGHHDTVKIYFGDTYEEVENKLKQFINPLKTENIVSYVESVQQEVKEWTEIRGFDKEPTENLAKSVMIEGAELLENYQFTSTEPDMENVKEEVADVMIYCIRICINEGWNYDEIVSEKLWKNNRKYPPTLLQNIEDAIGRIDDR